MPDNTINAYMTLLCLIFMETINLFNLISINKKTSRQSPFFIIKIVQIFFFTFAMAIIDELPKFEQPFSYFDFSGVEEERVGWPLMENGNYFESASYVISHNE